MVQPIKKKIKKIVCVIISIIIYNICICCNSIIDLIDSNSFYDLLNLDLSLHFYFFVFPSHNKNIIYTPKYKSQGSIPKKSFVLCIMGKTQRRHVLHFSGTTTQFNRQCNLKLFVQWSFKKSQICVSLFFNSTTADFI